SRGGATNILEFSPDGRWLAAGSDFANKTKTDNSGPALVLWDLEANPPAVVEVGTAGSWNRVCFSQAGPQLLIASPSSERGCTLRVFDLDTRQVIRSVGLSCNSVDCMSVTAEGQFLRCVARSPEGFCIATFETETGKKVREDRLPLQTPTVVI